MSDNRIYYTIEQGGKSQQAIDKYCHEHHAATTSWSDFAEANGTEKYYSGDWLMGILLKDPDLDIWQNTKKLPRGCYKPKRVKGSDLYKEFNALPRIPSSMDFDKDLGVDSPCIGMSIFFASFEKVGDQHIINLHKEVKPPEDATALKMSEFYKLKEAAESDILSGAV